MRWQVVKRKRHLRRGVSLRTGRGAALGNGNERTSDHTRKDQQCAVTRKKGRHLASVSAIFPRSISRIWCGGACVRRAYAHLTTLGKDSLTVVLFLIGTGVSRETLRRVGVSPMLQGVGLWIIVATASQAAIRIG